MPIAYVEYRPLSDDQNHGVTHHVVIVDGKELKKFKTQLHSKRTDRHISAQLF
jgi:hypothetical protein